MRSSLSAASFAVCFQVHYEGIQNYYDGLGMHRSTSHHNLAGLISIPPTQGAREWLVTSLVPNTQYTFNLTGTITPSDQSGIKIYSRPATIRFSTDYDAPPYVDRPEQDRRAIVKGQSQSSNAQVAQLRFHRASTKNGPIDRYYVVVHLIEHISYQQYVPQEVSAKEKSSTHFFSRWFQGRKECCYTAAVFNESQLPEVFVLGDGKDTRDWEPFQGRVYNNSPLLGPCKVKLVSWGFNRKKENLTTSSSTININLLPKVIPNNSQETFYNLLWIFAIIVLIFLIVILVIICILKYHRTKQKPLTPPPECVPFDLTPKVLTMEMQMPILPPTISPASSNEPVEVRRSAPPPPPLLNNNYTPKEVSINPHPPIHVDEFVEHLERLKANDNYKFSQEYEVSEGEEVG